MKLLSSSLPVSIVMILVMEFTSTDVLAGQVSKTSEASNANSRQVISPDGIHGTLVLVGGGAVPESVRELLFRNTAKTNDSESRSFSIVVLGMAADNPSAAADRAVVWLLESSANTDQKSDITGYSTVDEELIQAIDQADAVWICGGQQSRLAKSIEGSGVEEALHRLLDRNGTIAGTSAGAAIMSRVMIASGKDQPQISKGMDLLPGAIVDQHFTQRNRIGRSKLAVAANPHCFGLGIDEDTAVIVSGRQMKIIGRGAATCLLAKCDYRDEEVVRLQAPAIADLTQWRRAAACRTRNADPGLPRLGPPQVKEGALVIVGGGSMPPDIVNRFIELAGGKDAKIVVLPTAVPRDVARRQRIPGFLANSSASSVRILPQVWPEEIASEEFQLSLKEATGVWFGGGRQWHFVDAYENTNAISLFTDVLKRGGVIGGSSAGATIQGEFLVRGHPIGNTVMMAEGYERGFGFLPAVAIDQHFVQRGRMPDLIPVIRKHPELLGIGIDEGTALVVQGTKAEVIGQHSAHFLTSEAIRQIDASGVSETPAQSYYRTVETGGAIDFGELIPSDAKN
ncbi:MAG: cyanophycinase [Planctomycetaceae bacterium]